MYKEPKRKLNLTKNAYYKMLYSEMDNIDIRRNKIVYKLGISLTIVSIMLTVIAIIIFSNWFTTATMLIKFVTYLSSWIINISIFMISSTYILSDKYKEKKIRAFNKMIKNKYTPVKVLVVYHNLIVKDEWWF